MGALPVLLNILESPWLPSILAFFVSIWSMRQTIKHSKDLERYKAELESRTAKITRIGEKEFAILENIWQLIEKACMHILRPNSREEVFPLDEYTNVQLEEFLQASKLSESHKQMIRDTKRDKWHLYYLMRKLEDNQAARKAVREAQIFTALQRPFLSPDLVEAIDGIVILLRQITIDENADFQANHANKGVHERLKKGREDLPAKQDIVEALIRRDLYRGMDS